MKYQKKSVVVEAEQFLGPISISPRTQVDEFPIKRTILGREFAICWTLEQQPYIRITTLQGDVIANLGDWIIKDVDGFSRCAPDDFAAKYEDAKSANKKIRAVFELAHKVISAASHEMRCRIAQPDSGCTCGAIEDFKIHRTEFYRAKNAAVGGNDDEKQPATAPAV